MSLTWVSVHHLLTCDEVARSHHPLWVWPETTGFVLNHLSLYAEVKPFISFVVRVCFVSFACVFSS